VLQVLCATMGMYGDAAREGERIPRALQQRADLFRGLQDRLVAVERQLGNAGGRADRIVGVP
jgi:hypothetical protein